MFSFTKYLFGKLRGKSLIASLLLVQITSLITLFLSQSTPNLLVLRIVLGVFSLILLPGYCLMRLLPICFNEIEGIGFALILGLTYQLFVIYFMFFISIVIKQFHFQLVISLFSLVPILFLYMAKRKSETSEPWRFKRILSNPNYAIFCVLLVIRLVISAYYQNFSMNPHTDTSLIAEMARNLFVNGEFTSNAIHNTMPMYFQLGFNPHHFVYFSYALFFMSAEVSYLSVKIATIFYGVLMFFPVYSLVRRIFNEKVALGAVALIAVHPITLFFSSIPINGSEIMATLYLFSTICFIFFSITNRSEKCAAVAGICAFATFATRADYFYVLILLLPFLFITLSQKIPRLRDLAKICLFAYPLFLTRFAPFSSIAIILTFIYVAFTAWWLRTRKRSFEDLSISNIVLFNIIIFALYALYLVRIYSFPQFIEYATTDVLTDPAEKALFGVGTVGYGTFFSKFNTIWQVNTAKLTQPILFLSFISAAYLRKSKQVASFLSFPLAYSVIFSLTKSSIGGADHHRFQLAAYFFLVILAAFTLTQIHTSLSVLARTSSPFRGISIKLKNRKLVLRKKNLKSVLIWVILVIVLFSFLWPMYNSELDVVRAADIKSQLNYEPAINWILEHTSNDSVLMTRKPAEFVWFTDRISKMPWPTDLTIDELHNSIKSLKANYLIVDKLFLDTYTNQEIKNLYYDQWSQFGFVPVFKSSSEPYVIIYNVTALGSGIPVQEIGPEVEVEADNITLTKITTIEYFDPREANCYLNLSGHSTYVLRMLPFSLFFEAIEPAPIVAHIGTNEISFEGDPLVSYRVIFRTNLLLEIGWKDDLFLEEWELSPSDITFESDGITLSMGYNNTSPKTVFVTGSKKIDQPINVTQFPFIMIRYRFVNWTADDIKQVYFTVRLYDDSGVLEETPLVNPSNAGEWQVTQIPVKYSRNIAKIVLVVRTGPETSLIVEVDYVAIANVRHSWMDS